MANSSDASKWFRLPLNVVPTHYDITLKSDLETLRFSGTATIDLDVLEELVVASVEAMRARYPSKA